MCHCHVCLGSRLRSQYNSTLSFSSTSACVHTIYILEKLLVCLSLLCLNWCLLLTVAANNLLSVSFFKKPIPYPLFWKFVCNVPAFNSTNCPCTSPSCKIFYLSSLFLFENSSFVSPSSITFFFNAPLSISSLLSFRYSSHIQCWNIRFFSTCPIRASSYCLPPIILGCPNFLFV